MKVFGLKPYNDLIHHILWFGKTGQVHNMCGVEKGNMDSDYAFIWKYEYEYHKGFPISYDHHSDFVSFSYLPPNMCDACVLIYLSVTNE